MSRFNLACRGLFTALTLSTLSTISTTATAMNCEHPMVSMPSYGHHSPLNLGYGGISLNKTADLLLNVTDIQGAAYDKATGQIIFYGQSAPALPKLNISDMAVAVQSLYGLKGKSPQYPGVSINTEPSSNPNTVKVRYDGALENTTFGHTLYEADRILKGLTMRLDNQSGQPMHANASGYKSFSKRFFEEALPTSYFWLNGSYKGPDTTVIMETADDSARWVDHYNNQTSLFGSQRIWIEPGSVRGYTDPETQTLTFDPVTMKVLVAGSSGVNPANRNFALWMEQNYDAVANQYPVFHELKRLGKITAIVKWIQDNDIPLDLSMFSDFEPDRGHIPTETTKREVVNDVIIFGVHGLEGQTVFSLSGGVTYHLDNTNYAQVTQQQAVAIMDNALTQRPKDTNLHWTFNHAGQQYTAIAQTLERSRKDGNFIWAGTDTTFPTRGNLSLSFGRYYNSFSVRDEGLGMGWHVTPLGLRFSGEPLALTVNNQPIEGHFEFVMRTGAQEAAFTLLGVTDDRKLVYRAELGKTRIVYTPSTQIYEVLLPSGSINFNAAGQLTTVSDGGGQQLTYEYASFAGKVRLAAIRHSGGRAITLTYTQSGYLQTAATPARLQPTYSLTTGGQLREVRIGGVTQASFRYDTEGRLQEVMGPDGKTLAKADYDIYKRAHQVAKGTRDISPQTQAFDLGARKSTVTASNGFEQTLYYDDAFRPLTGTDALNRASHYRYESTFGPSRHMDAKGHQTDLSYDALGNLNRITNAQGQSLRAMYNAGHQPILTANASGIGEHFIYDDVGRLTERYHHVVADITEAGDLSGAFNYDPQNKTQYTYNSDGQLASLTNAIGHTWTYGYNTDGQVIDVVQPDGKTLTYQYDQWGRLESVSNRLATLKTLSYDELDRVISVTTPSGSVYYEYDDAHRLTQSIDANGNATQFYWHDTLLTQLTDTTGADTDYSYDAMGALSSLTRPNGAARHKYYDKAGRLVRIVEGLCCLNRWN